MLQFRKIGFIFFKYIIIYLLIFWEVKYDLNMFLTGFVRFIQTQKKQICTASYLHPNRDVHLTPWI